MAITYKKAKQHLAKYKGVGGHCSSAVGLDEFVMEVLQYMLYEGTSGNLRSFTFYAKNGCITLPFELLTPLKVRIEEVVGNVFTSFFSYHTNMRMDDCLEAEAALYDEPNFYPIVYDPPQGGVMPGIVATCQEDVGAEVIVKGVDLTGREIFTTHKGEKIAGVKLTPQKGKLVLSKVTFGKITEVSKTTTNGYVQLFGVDSYGEKFFLADYSPVETNPQYRRMRLRRNPCPTAARVSILGRIQLKPAYADEDLIPFDNFYALSLAGQVINSNYNKDVQTATVLSQQLEGLIEKEGNYKKVNNGQALEISPITAGSRVRNVVGGRRWGNLWRRGR